MLNILLTVQGWLNKLHAEPMLREWNMNCKRKRVCVCVWGGGGCVMNFTDISYKVDKVHR